jgi:hypothetical protein
MISVMLIPGRIPPWEDFSWRGFRDEARSGKVEKGPRISPENQQTPDLTETRIFR